MMITNNPRERQTILYPFVWWDDAFSDQELDSLVDLCEQEPIMPAYVGEKDKNTVSDEIRRSDIAWVHSSNCKFSWFFERMNNLIMTINYRFYNFNLNGYDHFQYTKYSSEQNGTYDWHMDSFMGETTPKTETEHRKLSLTLLLNSPETDFSGGDFLINTGDQTRPQTVMIKKGRVLAFPSFIPHKVAPVTGGVRKSAVIWVVGPKWV